MIFNSLEYPIFFIIFFILYWYVFSTNIKQQNILITISSYLFYGWWDWRFLSLLMVTTLSDYYCGKLLEDRPMWRKKILLWALLLNIGILAYFKYANFFVDSFIYMFDYETIGYYDVLDIILPVGISFYTFQSMAYIIDVYRGNIKASKSIIDYAAYISFFPQLVAGPIERASRLLPQIEKQRIFSYDLARIGCRMILWGLFKKIMVADNCAPIVNQYYSDIVNYNGMELMWATFLFSIQIYCDFSGYSDIARGSSRLLGIELMQNFRFPYFAKDIQDFWRRWHISLSTWFKDYIFIPLGGNRSKSYITVRNVFIVFFVSGLWHGADMKFIIWGIYHFIVFILFTFKPQYFEKLKVWKWLSILITFCFVCLGWIFFRSESLSDSLIVFNKIFNLSGYEFYSIKSILFSDIKILIALGLLFVTDYIHRHEDFGFTLSYVKEYKIRWVVYFILVMIILVYGNFNEQKFIYFDF
jgi:alginate O-acetyltransferase complex protein AlgI